MSRVALMILLWLAAIATAFITNDGWPQIPLAIAAGWATMRCLVPPPTGERRDD